MLLGMTVAQWLFLSILLLLAVILAARLYQVAGGVRTLRETTVTTAATSSRNGSTPAWMTTKTVVVGAWNIRWFIIVLLLIWLLYLFITGSSIVGPIKNTFKEGRWEMARTVTCKPIWNEVTQGWCSAGKFKPGTYRVIPRGPANSWCLGLSDNRCKPIPPEGLWLEEWAGQAVYDEFLNMAPKGGNRKVGSLVVKVGEMDVIDPFVKREFEIEQEEEIFVGPNIPRREAYFLWNRGEMKAEIQRKVFD